MRILQTLLFLVLSFPIFCQIDINVTIRNAYPDSIYFGNYFGKRFVKIETIAKDANNVFKISKQNLQPGIYAVVYKRDNTSVEEKKTNLFIDNSNQRYDLRINNYLQNTSEFYGSSANNQLKGYQKSVDSIISLYRKYKDEWIAKEDQQSFDQLVNLEQALNNEYTKFSKSVINTYLLELLKNVNITFPKYTGTLAEQRKQRQDFFDNIFINNLPVTQPQFTKWEQSIDFFDLYTIFSADGEKDVVSRRCISLLKMLEKNNKPLCNYYLNYLFNSFPRMTAHGYDAVTIDLVDAFLNSNETYDLPNEKIIRMKSTADKIRTLLPGKDLQPLTLLDSNKVAVNIHDIKSKYTLILVWSPDCSHCKKEIPVLKEKYLKYKNKGIKIATICAKRGAGLSECSAFMSEKAAPKDWILLNDDDGRSGYISKLDATGYPALYVLDENKRFILKRRGEQSDIELEKIFKSLK